MHQYSALSALELQHLVKLLRNLTESHSSLLVTLLKEREDLRETEGNKRERQRETERVCVWIGVCTCVWVCGCG